jgi:hypothetical protein
MIDRNKGRMSKTEASYKEAMGGSVAKKERAAEKKPIMRATGGPVKLAGGGVGKFRHDAATKDGAPKAVPRGKQARGI